MATKQSEYENVKRMATLYAKSENATVAIFKQGQGYSFIQVDCPEYTEVTPIEFISALL